MNAKKDMESRKIQKTGGSTLIVSLPKKWAQNANLEAGSEIRLLEQVDGTLLLNPSLDLSNNARDEKVLETDKGSGSHLFRSLIGIYLTGSSEIKIVGKPRLTVTQRKEIRKFSSYVVGFEIIEEEGNVVLLSDVSNPGALSFRRAVKRQFKIVRAMYLDSIKVIKGSDDISSDIIDRDKEVDKLQWFVERQFNMMLDNSLLAQKLSISPSEAVFYSHVSRYLERIADHSCRLAEIGHEAGQSSTSHVVKYAEEALDILDTAVSSFLNKKSMKATLTIDEAKKVLTKARKYFEDKYESDVENPREFSIAMDVIIRTLAYSTDICETAINLSYRKTK